LEFDLMWLCYKCAKKAIMSLVVMDDLISIISDTVGVDRAKAARLAGIVLNLMFTQGNRDQVMVLFAKMPGADALSQSNGGLAEKLAGGMMGGPLAAITRLQSEGISSDQQKSVIAAVIHYARAQGGSKLLTAAAANVPGLSGYL
jgi:hypothetical protein